MFISSIARFICRAIRLFATPAKYFCDFATVTALIGITSDFQFSFGGIAAILAAVYSSVPKVCYHLHEHIDWGSFTWQRIRVQMISDFLKVKTDSLSTLKIDRLNWQQYAVLM
jgi:hypothetical protein